MIIGILNQKGGVGKTSISTNLAWIYAHEGARVLLVDADPEAKNSTRWSSARQAEPLFPVIGMAKPTLHRDLPALARNYDITIIDGAPQLAEIGRSILLASRLVVIPVPPAIYDIWGAADTVAMVEEARVFNENLKAVFAVNRKIGNSVIGRKVREALAAHNIPVLETALMARNVYNEIGAHGLSVEEYDPKSPACGELRKLAAEIRRAGDDYETLLNTLSETLAGSTDG